MPHMRVNFRNNYSDSVAIDVEESTGATSIRISTKNTRAWNAAPKRNKLGKLPPARREVVAKERFRQRHRR